MRVIRESSPGVALSMCCLLALSGCGGAPTAKQRWDDTAKQSGAALKTVFPLAGKVTVDGQPPKAGKNVLLAVLCDPTKLDAPPHLRPLATVNEEGKFMFTSYESGDGMPEGDYILTFVQLEDKKKKGMKGPDQLKNLYNDPDKSDFKISHKSPGKKDYSFDLKVNGREAATPGPHALKDFPALD